jgi:hypothetical protein
MLKLNYLTNLIVFTIISSIMVKKLILTILFIAMLFSLEQVRSVLGEPHVVRHEIPEFQKGYSFLFYGFEDLDKDEYWLLKKTTTMLDQLQKDNVNSVSLVFPFSQATSSANAVSSSESITPSKKAMRLFIREAHKRDMVVMLRPIMDESNLDTKNGEWRGNINPKDRKQWMQSYSAMIMEYAKFAEEEKVEMYSIGTELPSMLTEKAEWAALVDNVRTVYDGKLLYAFNWNEPVDYDLVAKLDIVGFDAFYPINEPTKESWRETMLQMQKYKNETGKPVIFTEVGTRSQEESYKNPWAWFTASPVSQVAQADYFRSVCEASTDVIDGWHVWYVDLNSEDIDPVTDPTFDPSHKEAQKVIAECYGNIK